MGRHARWFDEWALKSGGNRGRREGWLASYRSSPSSNLPKAKALEADALDLRFQPALTRQSI